ncbi:hypothetical protein J7E50_24050 [Pedobacter sp. ISL-68]|uniref:hypothetical protein n=1 Tax=unclassified Pedobacter TaxID=2628915 RepID=UPI001BE5F3C0|nr:MULTISPECIES: hypothetical protein [unclassified Pedobacter]MBT2562801.1 hypothetical protein [Pedobacter sp. ISL-64]MBT2593314.1 hypothetical protein [Pedobacter sp. ISL-68]
MQRQVITLATGKKLYVDLAVNLARSFIRWNDHESISFIIVTDQPAFIPADVKAWAKTIVIEEGAFGLGFSPKLHLDKIVPAGQTLFIDSDCLIFGNIELIFNQFLGNTVSVLGGYISDGEWFGDVKSILQQFNLVQMPKFNGGIYYLENNAKAKEVYETARDLEKRYDEIGFKRLRNRPNDEVIMALAMQLHQMQPLIDDGTTMSDPQACPGGYKIDVVSGERWLINPSKPHPLHQDWYPFEKVQPLIFHFLGYYTKHYPYQREVFRLEHFLNQKLNWLTELQAKFEIEWPEKIKISVKNTFRPVYRKIFGIRKIEKSERTV